VILLQHRNELSRPTSTANIMFETDTEIETNTGTSAAFGNDSDSMASSPSSLSNETETETETQNRATSLSLSQHLSPRRWCWAGRNDSQDIAARIKILRDEHIIRGGGDGANNDDGSPILVWTTTTTNNSNGIRNGNDSSVSGSGNSMNEMNGASKEKVDNASESDGDASKGEVTPAPAPAYPTYIILDGTWKEANTMFRKMPFLASLPRLSLEGLGFQSKYQLRSVFTRWKTKYSSQDGNIGGEGASASAGGSKGASSSTSSSRYYGHGGKLEKKLCRDTGQGGELLCTAECVAALLDIHNDEVGSELIRSRLDQFQHEYMYGKSAPLS